MRNILGKFLVQFLSMVAIFLLVPMTMMADKPETVVNPQKPEKLPKLENNVLPISDAGEDQSVLVGSIVTFDGSDSIDPDGTIKYYEWMEDETILSNSIVFVKSDFSVGLHTITLTVTDNKRVSVSDSMLLTITTPIVSPPKTGQKESYDEFGIEVTDSSLEDDGFYQKGSTPNFSRDDSIQIVTDQLTGLMWQDDANPTKQWLTDSSYEACRISLSCNDTSGDTATSYCSDLTLGGFSDWRLPTRGELVNIVDYRGGYPTIDSTFQHLDAGAKWTSLSSVESSAYAWTVGFIDGTVFPLAKDTGLHTVCVRDDNNY